MQQHQHDWKAFACVLPCLSLSQESDQNREAYYVRLGRSKRMGTWESERRIRNSSSVAASIVVFQNWVPGSNPPNNKNQGRNGCRAFFPRLLACLHANADLGLTFFRDLPLLHLLFFCQNINTNKRLLHFIFSRLYNLCIRTPAS
jgi:hypothetical protein